jgi:uncharacterized protein (TIGR03435 family)
LRNRFKLVTHIETRNMKGYALVVARGGPKLKTTTAPLAPTFIGDTFMKSPSATMDRFGSALEALLRSRTLEGVPVVNETALTDSYEVTLSFAPLTGVTDSPLPSLFTALQEQLGLRLISREGIPVPVLVIDHVEYPTLD